MAREIICFLLVQCLICKVLSIYAPPTIQQYLHLTGSPHTTHTITVPAAQNPATNNQVAANNYAASQQRPSTGLPSFSSLALPNLVSTLEQLPDYNRPSTVSPSFYNLGLPNLISSLQQLPEQPRPSTGLQSFPNPAQPKLVSGLQQLPGQSRPSGIKNENPSSIDSNLLNNLAIALQLLIVSNILNAPPPGDTSSPKIGKEIPPLAEPTQKPCYPQYETPMPNSKFVGTSSYAEPNFVQTYNKPSRNSMSLMSPYEALGPSSPYSDPILSQYGSGNPRQDFQSPYSMMDKDLFSMNDLF